MLLHTRLARKSTPNVGRYDSSHISDVVELFEIDLYFSTFKAVVNVGLETERERFATTTLINGNVRAYVKRPS